MKKIILAIGVITLGLGLLLSGCGGTLGNPKEKVLAEAGAYAIKFPAVNPNREYVSTTIKNAMLSNSPVTVEAWIKSDGGSGTVFARGEVASGIILYVDTNVAKFAATDSILDGIAAGTTTVNDGTWHHLAGVLVATEVHDHTPTLTCTGNAMTGTHVDIYVNGHWENCAEAVLPALIDNCMNVISGENIDCVNNIGRDITDVIAGPDLFVGTIDEVRLWKQIRNEDQIHEWMNTEIRGDEWDAAGGFDNILGYWRFNEGVGSVNIDSSGYGNNGAKLICATDCGGPTETNNPWYEGWVDGYQF